MKRFFKDKKKLILLSVFLVVLLAGCSNYIDKETGRVAVDKIISLSTTWKASFDEGWFTGIFVWPVAQLINLIGDKTDAGIAIIVVTFLINIVIAAFSIKSQVATQRMQMIQPELNKIQKKYEGKTDERSKMMMAQEMQALYSKYQINPFSSILVMLVQLPVILAVYQAVMRAEAVINGSFMGIDLTQTPLTGMKAGQISYFVIFALMVVMQFLSMKFPMWLAEWKKKKSGKKIKAYANEQPAGGMGGSMNMMTYVSVGMIAFISLSWPLGMSFYWLDSSVARIIQNIVINTCFIKD